MKTNEDNFSTVLEIVKKYIQTYNMTLAAPTIPEIEAIEKLVKIVENN